MPNLTRASEELFRRRPDERFESLTDLWQHCQNEKEGSVDRWHQPPAFKPQPTDGRLAIAIGQDGTFNMNDWSFSQLCRLARVSKDTVNRVSSPTAARIFEETLPHGLHGDKPLQVLTLDDAVRSIHAASYTRLNNADLLTMLREFATDFQPPQRAIDPHATASPNPLSGSEPDAGSAPSQGGGTGLYCGEQDMFVFLIDPTGWTDINGQAFAPGFFLWNSEVGRRSVGVQTFWFQAVCQNHIVWDAVEVVEFSRKHTANVHESLNEIRRIIEALVEKRDERRDGFVQVIRRAMDAKLGEDAEEVAKTLNKHGISRTLAKKALEIAERQGQFTIFSLVDALTRLSGEFEHAGARTDADEKAGKLLALAA